METQMPRLVVLLLPREEQEGIPSMYQCSPLLEERIQNGKELGMRSSMMLQTQTPGKLILMQSELTTQTLPTMQDQ